MLSLFIHYSENNNYKSKLRETTIYFIPLKVGMGLGK